MLTLRQILFARLSSFCIIDYSDAYKWDLLFYKRMKKSFFNKEFKTKQLFSQSYQTLKHAVCAVYKPVFNISSVSSWQPVRLSMLSRSFFFQYLAQYSFQDTGCFSSRSIFETMTQVVTDELIQSQ